MSNEELEPKAEFTLVELGLDDIRLDKTRDGRYWRVTCWLPSDVLLQLRIQHYGAEEGDECIAEMKLVGPEEKDGFSEEGFMTLGEFREAPLCVAEGDAPNADEYPDTYRGEFITMVRYWGKLLEVMDCAPAYGTLKSCSSSD